MKCQRTVANASVQYWSHTRVGRQGVAHGKEQDMLGPFPGMDPYLEEASEWPDVHSRLITAISDALAAAVSPAFIVRIGSTVVGEWWGR